MNAIIKCFGACAIVVASVAPAHAQSADWFIEGVLGSSRVNLDGYRFGGTALAVGVSGVYRTGQGLGFEVGVRNHGTARERDSGVTVDLEAASILGGIVLEHTTPSGLTLGGRLGLHSWYARATARSGVYSASAETDDTDLYVGIGAQQAISPTVSLGVQLTQFKLSDTKVNSVDLRLGLRF